MDILPCPVSPAEFFLEEAMVNADVDDEAEAPAGAGTGSMMTSLKAELIILVEQLAGLSTSDEEEWSAARGHCLSIPPPLTIEL